MQLTLINRREHALLKLDALVDSVMLLVARSILDRVQLEVCGAHICLHFGQHPLSAHVLQLKHAFGTLHGIGGALTTLRVVPTVFVSMALQLLVTSLAVNVGHASHFDTFLRLLVIHVLECVFVEVYRSGTEPLRCCLTNLSRKAFEALTYSLSGKKFINCAPIVS